MRPFRIATLFALSIATAVAAPAAAIEADYVGFFEINGMKGPYPDLRADFTLRFDSTIGYDDLRFTQFRLVIGDTVFDQANTVVDIKMIGPVDERGFIFGAAGMADRNNLLDGVTRPDFRVRFFLDDRLQPVQARGGYILPKGELQSFGPGDGAMVTFVLRPAAPALASVSPSGGVPPEM